MKIFNIVGARPNFMKIAPIVEAMKHMNRVNSEISGTVKEILVQNEEAVEYDQAVMIIKKDH